MKQFWCSTQWPYKSVVAIHVEPDVVSMVFEDLLRNPEPLSGGDHVTVPLLKYNIVFRNITKQIPSMPRIK
jgi:hypothetical protein